MCGYLTRREALKGVVLLARAVFLLAPFSLRCCSSDSITAGGPWGKEAAFCEGAFPLTNVMRLDCARSTLGMA